MTDEQWKEIVAVLEKAFIGSDTVTVSCSEFVAAFKLSPGYFPDLRQRGERHSPQIHVSAESFSGMPGAAKDPVGILSFHRRPE
jgi:hypothetical protein